MPKQEVKNNANQVTITLDGDTADIFAGSNGQIGSVILRNVEGKDIIFVGGLPKLLSNPAPQPPTAFPANGLILLKESMGKIRIQLDAASGDVLIGGNGTDGDLILKDKDGNEKMRLSGTGLEKIHNGSILLTDEAGEQRVYVNSSGRLALGGNGADGAILILPDSSPAGQAAKPTIKLSGDKGQIWLYNQNGKDSIVLDPLFANLRLGGRDKGGDIALYPSGFGFNPNDLPAKPFVQLDGNNGVIVLRKKVADQNGFWGIEDSIVLNGIEGDIFLGNADCAEEFDISELDQIEPGTVMVLDQDGKLEQSRDAYDKKVAGVISGAGDYKPGIVLDKKPSQNNRMPVALVGKVYCKADKEYSTYVVKRATLRSQYKVTQQQEAHAWPRERSRIDDTV